MNFDTTPEETGIKEALKSLFKEDPEGARGFLRLKDHKMQRDKAMGWLKRLASVGYLSMGVTDATNSTALVAAQEELAALSTSLYLTAEISARLFGRIAARLEDGALVKEIVSGSAIGTAALTESNASYDQNPPATTAQISHGSFMITGSKQWVANAAIADWIACLAALEDRVGIFIIKGLEGEVVPGKGIEAPGLEDMAFHPISLQDCRASKAMALLPEKAEVLLETIKLWEDQILTSLSLGIMQKAYDEAVGHAKSHHSGGKPIIAHQEVGFKLAEMLTLLQAARLLAYRAAWMEEANQREAQMLCRCAKVFCAEAAEHVSAEAMQVIGARSLFGPSEASSCHMAAKYSTIQGNSVERSRVKIGEGVLSAGS